MSLMPSKGSQMRLLKRFAVKETLTEEDLQVGFKNVTRDGICSQSMVSLTQGAFLVGFALKLGAPNFVIGLLSAIIPLTQLIQIPSIYLVEKYRVRRAISVYASFGARIFLLLMALIPFLFSPQIGLIFLMLALFLNTSIGAISTTSWNSWMHDLIPKDRLGSVFSRRMVLATAVSIPIFVASGFFIDISKKLFPDFELYGYAILFSLGFVAGIIGIYFLSHIPEPRLEVSEKTQGFLRQILQPFKDLNFKKLIVFLGVWNFAVNLAAPFFTVYMLTVLGLEMSGVIVLMTLSMLMNITFMRLWGRFSDRFSNKSVLGVCGPLFIFCIFLWTFTAIPGWVALTIPLLITIHLLMGISTAGISLASGNIGLKLAPRGQATTYLATNSFTNSLAAGFAPVLGGALADSLRGTELSWTLTWTTPTGELAFQTLNFRQWEFVFFFAVLIGIYSIHRLAMVQEVGEVKEEIVLKELMTEVRRGLRSVSSAVGLQRMVEFQYSLLRHLKPTELVKHLKRKKDESPTEAEKSQPQPNNKSTEASEKGQETT
nr:MFS transporter [Candidatus Njordarchaeota archaeon]